MNKSNPFFKTPLPKAKQINKALVAVVAGIIMMILLMAFWNSMTDAPFVSTSSTTSLKKQVSTQPSVPEIQQASWVSDLPQNYGDSQKIDLYLSKRFPERDHSEAQDLKVQMQALENSQKLLKAQLEQMHKRPTSPVTQYSDYLDREAMSSSIFFAGGAPHPEEKSHATDAATPETEDDKKRDPNPPYYPRDSYEGQNMQKDKKDFLEEKIDEDIYNQNTVQYPPSRYVIQAGTVIPGILQTKIVSDLPGVITAVVRNNVYDSISGHYILIPKGSKLIGEYSSKIAYGQNKLQVKFTRLIRSDGSSIVLPNQQGVDDQGIAGFEDQVDNHWKQILGAGALMTVFNIPGIVAQHQLDNSRRPIMGGADGTSIIGYENTMGSMIAASSIESLGKSTSQIGNEMTRKSLDIQPTILIDSGYHFSIMVTKDIVLPPVSKTPKIVAPE